MGRDDICWLTATEVLELVRAGEVSAQEVVRSQLDRIERVDPRIHAYVHVDGRAHPGQGPLAGVTIAVKDTDPVAGMPWTSGSPRWRDRVADEDTPQVRAARERGAAILGKVNTPELAASVGTVNPLFPPTENPWRPGWTPGGSSGGSAAAVAAALCTISFGSDMGGSVRIPSSCCGVFGLRPSPFRVPTETPDGTRLSVRGPLARSAADLRIAFELMSGQIAPEPRHRPLSVIAPIDGPVAPDPACSAAQERAVHALTHAGHHVVCRGTWDPLPVARAYQVVRPVTMGVSPGEPDQYGPAVRDTVAEGRRTSGLDFVNALQDGLAAASFVHDLLHGHDILLVPTLGRVPMPIDQVPPFLHEEWIGYTQFVLPVSFAGLPAVSVPAGIHDGLPVGVQLVAPFGLEWQLLDVAAQLAMEPGFGFQRPPDLD